MKMTFLFVAFLSSAFSAQAQYQFRFQVDAAALRTHLYNAEDNASGMVTSSPKITPNGGFTFSWVNTDKSGFQGLRAGLQYLAYKQTTDGASTNGKDPFLPTGTTSSHIHYISLPLEVRFGLSERGRVVPFVTVGGYVSRLLSYTESSAVKLFDRSRDETLNQYTTITNKTLSFHGDYEGQPVAPVNSKLLQGIYQPWNFGVMASVGADFNIGHRHFFSVRIPVRYTLNDVERKGAMEYEPGEQTLYGGADIYYWDYNTPKAVFDRFRVMTNTGRGLRGPVNPPPQRGATHSFSYGLELSYGLKLIPKKRY